MSIWKSSVTPEQVNRYFTNTAMGHMGITVTEIGEATVTAEMPVDARTHQPAGLLHGGASVLLAETVGSFAASLCADADANVVGLEINANHLSGVRDGDVVAVASPEHLGFSTQVWTIRIHHKQTGKPVCISRLTMAVLRSDPSGS